MKNGNPRVAVFAFAQVYDRVDIRGKSVRGLFVVRGSWFVVRGSTGSP